MAPLGINTFLLGAKTSPYQIEQSLRFDGSSYFHRTNSGTGNRDTYTFSFWVKRAALGGNHTIWSADGESNSNQTSGHDIRFVNGSVYATNDELIFSSYIRPLRATTGVQRDPSAWAHYVIAVDTTQATQNDRIKMWVNGDSTITDAINTGYWPGQNQDTSPNRSGDPVEIGRNTHNSSARNYGNFYLAEFHYVDGTAYDETSFGEYDDNGVWRPIEVSGLSYGTNGWYMKFDPSATNGIGHDHSGNGNDFTASGFTTSGTGTDVMSDTPTTNWCTLNPLSFGPSNADMVEGNLRFNQPTSTRGNAKGTIAVSSGKWYWEVTPQTTATANVAGGILGAAETDTALQPGNYATGYSYYSTGETRHNGVDATYGASYGAGDVIGTALDLDAGTLVFYKNGVSQGTAYSSVSGTFVPAIGDTSTGSGSQLVCNFGQHDFQYTPPTNFLPLNTSNLPAPTIKDGSDYFDTLTYTGPISSTAAAGTTGAVTGLASGFTPDLVWIKCRNQANFHQLFDQVRGVDANGAGALYSNSTDKEVTTNLNGGLSAFNDGGFTVIAGSDTGGRSNNTGSSDRTYAAWCWDAGGTGSSNTAGSITSTVSVNPSAGFSIVSYTGTGANATVGHGLGVAPQFFFGRNRDDTGGLLDWIVYHESIGNTGRLKLNTTGSTSTSSTFFQNTSPSSTVISIGTSNDINKLNDDYIMYCFAEVEGYSKFGSYTGTNTTDNAFVWCGFAPAWLLVKSYGTGGTHYDWRIYDSKRNTYNPVDNHLEANQSLAEDGDARINEIDFLSNGFKIRNSYAEVGSSTTYIFAAFAEHPQGGSGVSPATAR
jgi:hypothetical protein